MILEFPATDIGLRFSIICFTMDQRTHMDRLPGNPLQ